jgi:hypothetical protein
MTQPWMFFHDRVGDENFCRRPYVLKTWWRRRKHISTDQAFNKVIWGFDEAPYLFKPQYGE